jgi:hypothetical protein
MTVGHILFTKHDFFSPHIWEFAGEDTCTGIQGRRVNLIWIWMWWWLTSCTIFKWSRMGISVQPEIFGEWRRQNDYGEEDWQWVPVRKVVFIDYPWCLVMMMKFKVICSQHRHLIWYFGLCWNLRLVIEY